MITVLIADDHSIVRFGLCALLGSEPDIEVVGEAANGLEAVKMAKALRPDVVVMDLVMPRLDGTAATAQIHAAVPSARILVLTSFDAAQKIAAAMEAGATGALLKTGDEARLVEAVREVAGGGRAVSPEIERLLKFRSVTQRLTSRQLEVLRLMSKGLTNKTIAELMNIRADSVGEHVVAILGKLGVANRTEAVALAMREHLV